MHRLPNQEIQSHCNFLFEHPRFTITVEVVVDEEEEEEEEDLSGESGVEEIEMEEIRGPTPPPAPSPLPDIRRKIFICITTCHIM